jgi:hypothetical protein
MIDQTAVRALGAVRGQRGGAGSPLGARPRGRHSLAFRPMKGRKLSESVAGSIGAALALIEVEPDQVVAWWQTAEDDRRILVATPIGLLTYRHEEVPNNGDQYETILDMLTPWSDVRGFVQTTTRWDPEEQQHLSWLDFELEGFMKASVRPTSPEAKALSEFAADCLRRATG